MNKELAEYKNTEIDINARLKIQDLQFAKLKEAKENIKNKDYDKANIIIEEIMYKEGLIVNGVTWPLLLAESYFKLGEFDKCWRYLQLIYNKYNDLRNKINEYRVKIRKKEKGWNDALYFTILSITYTFAAPSDDAIEKKINPIIKNIDNDIKDEILILIKFARETKKGNRVNEIKIRKEFKRILGM